MNDSREWDQIKRLCPRLYKKNIHFECGIGWFDIIFDLSLKIEKVLDNFAVRDKIPPNEEIFDFEIFATQVKEKYGTLRFYMTLATDEIYELIEKAERLSSQTCELCGDCGEMRGHNWYEVRCDKCYK